MPPITPSDTNKTERISVSSEPETADNTYVPISGSGIVAKSGNVARLDFPLPFFLQNHVFNKFGKKDYSWVSKESMIMLVDNTNVSRPVPVLLKK